MYHHFYIEPYLIWQEAIVLNFQIKKELIKCLERIFHNCWQFEHYMSLCLDLLIIFDKLRWLIWDEFHKNFSHNFIYMKLAEKFLVIKFYISEPRHLEDMLFFNMLHENYCYFSNIHFSNWRTDLIFIVTYGNTYNILLVSMSDLCFFST